MVLLEDLRNEDEMKIRWTTVLLLLVFFAGLGLILYPSFSDWWNYQHQSRAIVGYVEQVENLDEAQYEQMLYLARQYNERLVSRGGSFALNDEENAEYESLLNVDGSGIMCYLEIPKIDTRLPVYHGSDESVLQVALGHLPWSSLPVGGESTHTVISGHRGLPSAKLLTNLDQMENGDIILIRVLKETLTYQVDQILTVLPDEMENLTIEPGQDYCTLVTCTPYGINTHRLLVRGHRIPNLTEREIEDMTVRHYDPVIIASLAGAAAMIIGLVIYLIYRRRKKKRARWAHRHRA